MTYIPAELRRQVVARASNCCEYCRLAAEDSTFSLQIDHIIAEKHGGETALPNLALSCPDCNLHKGSNISSIDPETQALTYLFHPRTQIWNDHFSLEAALLVPKTPEGRVTIRILELNLPRRVKDRADLITLGRYPCGV